MCGVEVWRGGLGRGSVGRFDGRTLRAANYVGDSDGQQSSGLLSDLPTVSAGRKSARHLLKFPERVRPQARYQAVEEQNERNHRKQIGPQKPRPTEGTTEREK